MIHVNTLMEAHLGSLGLNQSHLCTCSQLAAQMGLTYVSVSWCWLWVDLHVFNKLAQSSSYGGRGVPDSKRGFSRVHAGEDCIKNFTQIFLLRLRKR